MSAAVVLTAAFCVVLSVMVSCVREDIPAADCSEDGGDFGFPGSPVEVRLSVGIEGMSVDVTTGAGIRADGMTVGVAGNAGGGMDGMSVEMAAKVSAADETDAERAVGDLWVFQYDASDGRLVRAPQYLLIEDQASLERIPLTLSDNNGSPSVVYLVANTGDPAWVPNASMQTVTMATTRTGPNATTGASTRTQTEAPSKASTRTRTQTSTQAKPASSRYSGFATLSELKTRDLPVREPIFASDGAVSIPMGGGTGEDGSLRIDRDKTIPVTLTRMYAKLMIAVDLNVPDTEIYSLGVGNIPQYCRVTSLEADTPDLTQPASYPDISWVSRTFRGTHSASPDDTATATTKSTTNPIVPSASPDDTVTATTKSTTTATSKSADQDYPWVIYVPENLQGRSDSGVKLDPTGRALALNLIVAHTDSEGGVMHHPFTFYPGADATSDYNVRRNSVYRIHLTINELSEARVQSANSVVASPGQTVALFPYFREDSGGGFDFADYLDPSGERGQKINSVEILWQTKDCIGDNSAHDRVMLIPNEQTHSGYEKLYVRTQSEGNAVVAARNAAGDIIWSWHIWVTEGDPANEANALTYYTYAWDETGIHYDSPRIPGPRIMKRNLGALADEPDSDNDLVRTYGLLYQWGRKDPFPPLTDYSKKNTIGKGGYFQHDYDAAHTETVYANDNTTVVEKTAYTEPSKLFHSISGADINSDQDGMGYTIAHPTVFMCGTREVAVSLSETDKNKLHYVNDISNYVNRGAWSEDDHVNTLWGGLELTDDMTTLPLNIFYLGTLETQEVSLHDDYGREKTIFDPCPAGWRVPSSDLWLGFSRTSAQSPTPNPTVMADVNYDPDRSDDHGMYMYLGPEWREGDVSFFPTQGYRLADGCGWRVGVCGNNANANTDANDRVNMVHIHNEAKFFNIFETRLVATIKATANPIRCVRDTK